VKLKWTARSEELSPSLRHPLLCFLAAFRFLTVLPIHWQSDQDGNYFQHSLHYFPVLGCLIGLAVSGFAVLLGFLFPESVVAVMTMILLAGVSGCLHLDGLADTADGFFSSRPKERILEIMRDSRTGPMGVIALIFVLLLKFIALWNLSPAVFLKAVILIPLAGRCAIVQSMALLPYAREEGGLGRLFYSKHCRISALWSLVFPILLIPFVGFRPVVVASCTTIGIVLLFSFWSKKKIGGATGDTLGAICEITEMAVAVSFTTLFMS
jgi:adenosylcobinamide-GDP ribazoletransferase